jgi:hypothetical protein
VTIAEVLAPFGVDEDEFAEQLSRELRAAPDTSASRLTEAEAGILREHGGVEPIGDEYAVRKAVLRSASSNLAELTRESLSVGQAAALLLVDGSRVRHRVRDRALYAFKIGAGLRLPSWQFARHASIPGLRAVLAALPADLHPLEVAGFMTTAEADLAVGEQPTSPRDWLIGGGDVSVVVDLAAQLDRW